MTTKQQLAEAKKLLEEQAPKGEFLAYINKEEAQILKNLGGSGRIIESTQIPSFEPTVTQTLPAPFISEMGLEFSDWLTGHPGTAEDPTGYTSQLTPIDYSTFMGDQYVAPQDQLTLDAQAAAADPTYGLGMYQPYLDQAGDFSGYAKKMGLAGMGIDPTTGTITEGGGVADPYLTSAAGAYGTGLTAAQTGQNVGASNLASAGAATDLASLAALQGQGVGQQYLTAAQGFTGPTGYQEFMSPYQQNVIDATLSEFDRQSQIQQNQLAGSAGAAYGGSRLGVAQSELANRALIDRSALQAQLLESGYLNAQQAAQTAYGQNVDLANQAQNQALQNMNLYGASAAGQAGQAGNLQNQAAQNLGLMSQVGGEQLGMGTAYQTNLANQLATLGGLGQEQMGLGTYGLTGLGNQMTGLQGLGTANQQYQQQILNAQQALAQGQAFAPQQAGGFFGQQMAQLMGGMPATSTYTTTPDPSTWQTIGGGLQGLAGILGAYSQFQS